MSVAEMGVCAAEMWGMCYRNGGMYQLQIWGGEVSMFCRNGEYNYTSSRYVSGEIM